MSRFKVVQDFEESLKKIIKDEVAGAINNPSLAIYFMDRMSGQMLGLQRSISVFSDSNTALRDSLNKTLSKYFTVSEEARHKTMNDLQTAGKI